MQDLVVETTSGKVSGKCARGTRRWLGIPYAIAERFGAPQPVPAWESPFAAIKPAPQVPQLLSKRLKHKQPHFCEARSLALNIWTPEEPGPHPVFFWIHGGAFTLGSANGYRGHELARDHKMVVVAINYRLGALGFGAFGEALGIPAIPSNLGLRDQIAALEWVRDNIAAFDGDPARVTIAGESAGSISVSLLMIAPAARGLFHGAILQSGALNLIQDKETARRLARRLAELLDLDQGSSSKLQSMSLEQLLRVQSLIDVEEIGGTAAGPYWDGDLLPASLAEAEKAERAPVPIIAGSNAEETRLFEWLGGDILPLKREQNAAILKAHLPDPAAADEILACYPDTKVGNRALATDLTFAMPTRHFAEDHVAAGNQAWAYRFDWKQWLFGAAHAMELLFLFPLGKLIGFLLLPGPMMGGKARLARTLRSHWAHFVHHGCPRDDWPPYEPGARKVMLLNKESRIAENPEGDRVAAWKGRLVPPRC